MNKKAMEQFEDKIQNPQEIKNFNNRDNDGDIILEIDPSSQICFVHFRFQKEWKKLIIPIYNKLDLKVLTILKQLCQVTVTRED